jgi:hypothetical protein
VGIKLANVLKGSLDTLNVVVRPFDGFIFLCGGAIESKAETVASARHYALSRMDKSGSIAGRRVVIAEKMTTLMQGDDYNDLLEFEEHIAALCACVLIFVESPGSIAELGSFSVMRNLAPRLLVVCEQNFESNVSPSFIFLGPLASLRRRRNESVQMFPISSEKEGVLGTDSELLDECWEYIEEAVINSIRRPIPESKLDKNELSHQMVLVASLIDLLVAIKVGELEEVLHLFDLYLHGKPLRRILRILEQFELISAKTYGNDQFYHSALRQPLVNFKPHPDSGVQLFDSVRFKIGMLNRFEEDDARRAKAIKAFLRGVAA